LKDGRVLVAAGFNGAPNLMHDTATTEIYDAATNQWITAASLTTERDAHTATLLPDGTVLVAGGANMPPQWLASAERYDPTTNTWSSAGTLATARAFHTATLLQTGAVLVTGGYGGTTWQGTTSSELY